MDELLVEVAPGEGVSPPLEEAEVERAVRHVLRAEGHAAAELSVALLDDTEITRLNREYLGHDRPTDVISFALHEPGEPPLGDVYVGVDPGEELLRLAVHGTLHVLGYDHPEGEERTGSAMFLRQEELLREIGRGGGLER